METFSIGEAEFELPSAAEAIKSKDALLIHSSLHDYTVEFRSSLSSAGDVMSAHLLENVDTVLVIDRRVLTVHLTDTQLAKKVATLALDVTEETKTIDGVTEVLDFLVDNDVSKEVRLIVAGGGIVQDTVGFACAIYRRGMPWTYYPTTLLAQSDSCIGSKTGINFKRTKNLLGVFFAPEEVILHSGFLETLDKIDLLSGLGEIFKLCVTAGPDYLEAFDSAFPAAQALDVDVLEGLARLALLVKKPVIEVDEFDRNVRRGLNFGHSIGHAIEVVTDHRVAHGIAVSFGVLVESAIARAKAILSEVEFEHLIRTASALLPESSREEFHAVDVDALRDVLTRDKKASRSSLVLPVLSSIGHMEFIDLAIDRSTTGVIGDAMSFVSESLA